MTAFSKTFEFQTSGKGTYEITDQLRQIARESGVKTGLATAFIQHTSASLILFENADSSARVDLDNYFERLVPEDDDSFCHTAEGPDDMTSHIRSTLTASSQTIPIAEGRLQLGTWQGLFIFEHRCARHRRRIVVTILGE